MKILFEGGGNIGDNATRGRQEGASSGKNVTSVPSGLQCGQNCFDYEYMRLISIYTCKHINAGLEVLSFITDSSQELINFHSEL